jgi:hypothetical protein
MDSLKHFIALPLSSHDPKSDFLIGLRGFFAIQSFLHTFLLVFAPASVVYSANAQDASHSPTLQKAFKFVSILFWNDGIIYSAFILLSARTICIPFMRDRTRLSIAGSVFRRGIRLWFPVAVALAINTGVMHATGYEYIDDFADETGNISILVPYKIDNALMYFNSIFNLFWVTTRFSEQAGNYAFPGQMMWVINVIYMQR